MLFLCSDNLFLVSAQFLMNTDPIKIVLLAQMLTTSAPHCLHSVTSETTRNFLMFSQIFALIMFQCSCLLDNVHPRAGGEQTASLMLAWRGSNSPTLNHPGTRIKKNQASFVIKTFQIIIWVSSAETEMLEVLLEIVTLKLLCILHLNPLVEIIKSMWNSQLLISKEQRRMLIRGLDIKILNVILKYQNSTVV